MSVDFQDVVDALQMLGEDERNYYDCQLDELVYLSSEEFAFQSREGLAEEIEEDETGRFILLPTYFDFNPYDFMVAYIEQLPDDDLSDRLSRAIRGRGAFRHFKDELDRSDRLENWYAFESKCCQALALEWCRENEIVIVDDRLKKI